MSKSAPSLSEISKIVSSVYSNEVRLSIALKIREVGEASAQDLSEVIPYTKHGITIYLKQMLDSGIMRTRRESHYVYYSLTDFGRKILGIV
jgi:predicted transcriptional regulator with HTH domain